MSWVAEWSRRALIAAVFSTALAAMLSAGIARAEPGDESFQDAANFQNNKAYDLAIEEWEKFLKNNPKHTRFVQAQHYLGICYLQLQPAKYEKAIEAFEGVVKVMEGKDPPKFDQLEESYLNLGWSNYTLAANGKKELFAKAIAQFEAQLKKFPKGATADQANYWLGEARYGSGDKAKSIEAYQKVVTDFPQSSQRCPSLYALGMTYQELNQFDKAGESFDTFLGECKDHPLTTEVKLWKGETVFQAGLAAEQGGKGEAAGASFADAEKRFGEVAGVEKFNQADFATSRQALCLWKQNKAAEAGALYAKLIATYPQSSHAGPAALSAARCFYQAKQNDEARKWFQKVIESKSGEAVEAAYWMGKLDVADGKFAEAYKTASKALETSKEGNFVVSLKLLQADALYNQAAEKAKSIPLYLAIAKDHEKDPQAPQALYNASFTALELGQHADGLKYAEDFLQKYKQDTLAPDVMFVAAECHLLTKQYPEAATKYNDLIKQFADNPAAPRWKLRLGLIEFLQKKYAEAIKSLSAVVEQLKAPEQVAEANYLIGASQLNLEKFDEAAKALEAAAKASDNWRQADEVALNLARAYRGQKKFAEAKTAAQQLVDKFPQSSLLDQAQYMLAESLAASGDQAGAAKAFGDVAAKYPQSATAPHALYMQGFTRNKLGEHPKAIESLTSLITTHANHALIPAARQVRANSRHASGDFKGALEDVNAILGGNLKPEEKGNALFLKALCEVGSKDFAAAAATLEGLLKDQPMFAAADRAIYEWAWALKGAGKDADAVPLFVRLTKEKPDSPFVPEAWFQLGQEQYTAKKYDEAATSYTQARAAWNKLKPQELSKDLEEKILYKLGWSLFHGKQYSEALESFQAELAAFGAGSLAADAQFMIGECLFRQEKFTEALPAYQKAKALPASSKDIEVLILLHGGQAASQAKKYDDAMKWLEELVTKHPTSQYISEAQYEQGNALQQQKKPDEALKLFEQAATNHRGEVGARARFMMGEIHFGKKDFVSATKEFQRVMFGYGGEAATEEVKKWQAKSGYESGRCFEVQIKDEKNPAKKSQLVVDAVKNYTYVVEKHPNSAEKAEAANRLKDLAKLQ